jgi:hypothetical protein
MQESKNFYDIKAYYETLFKDFQNKKETSTSPSGEPGESDQDNSWKIFKRWENFYEPRVYPSGEMNYEQNIFEEYQKIKTEKSNIRNEQTNESWSPIGPNAVPQYGGIGRINAVAFDPNDTNIIWVGTPSGGLWKSNDGGITWTTNTDLLPVLGVSEIIIDPSNPNIMYIAMGDRDAGDTQSIGILKSTDGGVTWVTTGLSYTIYDFFSIRRILIHPQQTNILIAATNHLGVAPRPAHSSPDGPLYLAATFRPFNVLPRMPRATLPPSDATELPSASNCRSRVERYPVNASST